MRDLVPPRLKTDPLLVRFDQLVDHGDAIFEVRRLILALAIQGRLVERNPKDKPAAESFPKLALVASEPGDDTYPAHWLRVPLGQMGEWRGGGTPSKSRPEFWEGKIPWVSPKDMKQLQISDAQDHISKAAVQDSAVRMIPQGSLLMVVRGMILARAFPVALTTREVTINQDMKALLPAEQDTTDFLLVALRAFEPVVLAAIERSTHGTCKLETDTLHALAMPVPPLAEQKRIVAKVDELMALCDRLEAQLQERDTRQAALARAALARFADAPTPANLELLFHDSFTITPADLRKTILTLAVQGHLVPQDPNDEPAEDSFGGLPTANEGSGNGEDLPPQWRCCTYRTLTTLVTSGSRGWKEYYSKSGAIFIRTQNIKTDRLILDDVAFVDLPKSAEGMRAQVLKDDIMITITGANVTKAARVVAKIPEAYVSQHIALTRPRWPEMSPWLHLCFVSPGAARGTLERLAYGDKPGLNLENIRDLVFPIPPLAEQHRIVAKVGQLAALVDQWESQIAATRTTADHLLSALVDRLTSQGAG